MRTKTAYILPLLFVFQWFSGFGQESVTVSKPVLEIQGENLIIKYDILNSKPGNKFSVSLEIADSLGHSIIPESFSGDMGENIEGGNDKKIIWNFISDNIKDEVNIEVSIILRFIKEPVAEEISTPAKTLSRRSLMLQSVALPGLGLSKIHNNKPYWIMGIAGYGIIAGSAVYYGLSRSNYQDFLDASDPDQEIINYDKYKSQKKISMYCAIGAAALWVADLILVYNASSKPANLSALKQNGRLLLSPDYDIKYSATILRLKYTF